MHYLDVNFKATCNAEQSFANNWKKENFQYF